jgi:hypothetical protein
MKHYAIQIVDKATNSCVLNTEISTPDEFDINTLTRSADTVDESLHVKYEALQNSIRETCGHDGSCDHCVVIPSLQVPFQLCDGCRAVLIAAQKESEGWIPVGERLPELYKDVNATYTHPDFPVVSAYYGGESWTAFGLGQIDPRDVLYWRPLPAPPAATEQKEAGE